MGKEKKGKFMKVWIDMKLTLGAIHDPTEDILKFAKQLGVKYIIVHTPEEKLCRKLPHHKYGLNILFFFFGRFLSCVEVI